jgi:hypothetical protein
MLSILWRDTSSELWTLVHSFIFILLFTIYSHYLLSRNNYILPHDKFNPLFTANRWDWQPHCKFGQSTLVVLYAGSTLLLVQSYALDKAPYINCLELRQASEHQPSKVGSFSYWFDTPQFHTEGKLAAVLIIPSSWGSKLGASQALSCNYL